MTTLNETVKEVKERNNGEYIDIEFYKSLCPGRYFSCPHTDNITSVYDDVPNDATVLYWDLMDEEDYHNTILANTGALGDLTFEDIYGVKDAKVLVIVMPYNYGNDEE